jgi:hypothetical protein
MTTRSLGQFLSQGMRPLALRVEAGRLLEIEAQLLASGIDSVEPDSSAVVSFFLETAQQATKELASLRQSYVDFASNYQNASGAEECDEIVLEFAKRLGSRGIALREDRRALSRWFGYDAVVERFGRREQIAEQRIGFLIERFGSVASAVMRQAAPNDALPLFRSFQIESLATPLLAHIGDERVRIEAFRCLSRCLTALPPGQEIGAVAAQLVQFVNRAALDPGQNIWIQSEALALVLHTSPTIFARTVQTRLSEPGEGDDLFVRRRAVRLIASHLRDQPELWDSIELILADPSAYVRQELPGSIVRGCPEKSIDVIRRLTRDDDSASVRASGLLSLPLLAEAGEELAPLRALLEDVFESEEDSYVLRAGLRIADELQKTVLIAGDTDSAEIWYHEIHPSLEQLHTQAESLVVRRAAARTHERLWSRADCDRRAALEIIERARDETPPRKRRSVSREALGPLSPNTIGRLMAVAAELDFGLFADTRGRQIRITRGHRFGFRLWRFLHELRNPATDKRQAHRHTIGRVFRGDLHAPSAILSELSETTVPGEPLFIEEEDGWRPYLPLVDEVISSLDEGFRAQTLEIYTAEGVTEVTSPHTLFARFHARSVLTRKFLHYARLRNWRADRGGQASSYIEALRELGISIRMRPHDDQSQPTSSDESVMRFFEEAP